MLKRPAAIALIWLLLCGGLSLRSALAEEQLFVGEAPSQDDSDSGRELAIRAAFSQMITRVSGDRSHARNPALKPLIAQASRYVVGYGYRESPVDGVTQRSIRVTFARDRLEPELLRLGVPIWRSHRPNLLAWIATEQQGERRLLQPGLDEGRLAVLREGAEARGMPLLLPLMDLEDRSRVRVEALWAGQFEDARQAAQRYGAQVVLVGLVSEGSNGLWQGNWKLFGDDLADRWTNTAGGYDGAVLDALESAADAVAKRYAPSTASGQTHRVLFEVDGIRNHLDYARIHRMLAGMGSIGSRVIRSAEPNRVTWELSVIGAVQGLQREVALGGLLRERPAAGPTNGADLVRLSYELAL